MVRSENSTPSSLDASIEQEANPTSTAIREELAALLADNKFRTSTRRKKILAYIVEQTLAGGGARLKGFDLAVAVLGRDDRFDPQIDPIVRVEIGKLRRELDLYYLTSGASHGIRIDIPKGHNAPTFQNLLDPPKPTAATFRPRPPVWLIASLGFALALLFAVAILEGQRNPLPLQDRGPAVFVEPFEALTGDEAGGFLAIGLTNGLVADLIPFDGLQVFAGQITGSDPPPSLANIPVYVVDGSVERTTNSFRASARLMDRASRRVIWSQTYSRPLTAANVLMTEDELSAGIAARLAQVYGLINLDVERKLARDWPKTLFSYECVQRAFAYRRTFDSALYPAVRTCLETSVQRDPGYADVWAMLAFAHLDAARYHLVPPEQVPAELDDALSAAQRSVELAPERVRPLQALAAAQFMRGDFADAEQTQRRAIEINPNDPESLAQLGWRMMARGRPKEAIELLGQAIDLSLRSPAWYHMTLSLAHFDAGSPDLAYTAAVRGQDFCCGLGKATLAIMAAEIGASAEARAALETAIAQSPLLERDPHAFWATWQLNETLIARLNAGLVKAGLPTPPSGGP